jgi:hypothetical protein
VNPPYDFRKLGLPARPQSQDRSEASLWQWVIGSTPDQIWLRSPIGPKSHPDDSWLYLLKIHDLGLVEVWNRDRPEWLPATFDTQPYLPLQERMNYLMVVMKMGDYE